MVGVAIVKRTCTPYGLSYVNPKGFDQRQDSQCDWFNSGRHFVNPRTGNLSVKTNPSTAFSLFSFCCRQMQLRHYLLSRRYFTAQNLHNEKKSFNFFSPSSLETSNWSQTKSFSRETWKKRQVLCDNKKCIGSWV